VGGSTYTSVDITTGRFCFGMADNGDSGAGRGGEHFTSRKKRAGKSLLEV